MGVHEHFGRCRRATSMELRHGDCLGPAMGLSWDYHGTATGLPWDCLGEYGSAHDSAMTVLRNFHGNIRWNRHLGSHDYAMGLS